MEIQANLHVYCYYEVDSPAYRIWIDNALYNERIFWADPLSYYIEEIMFFELEPGEHIILIEKVSEPKAKLWAEKLIIKYNNKQHVFDFPIDPQDKQIIKFTIE